MTETRELIPNGQNTLVTDENKREYVKLVCQMKMTGAIRQQLNAFLEGFYDIIPKKLVGIFTEQELELLISGLPTIDIDNLKANTEYHKYQATSLQVKQLEYFFKIRVAFASSTSLFFCFFGGEGVLMPCVYRLYNYIILIIKCMRDCTRMSQRIFNQTP